MNNSNWHVPLSKMNEQQRDVVKRVYGGVEFYEGEDRYEFLINVKTGVMACVNPSRVSEEITPEEAFKRLGLDRLLEPESPKEQGINRHGLDMPYFRNLINRELNCDLTSRRPSDLARVLARMARAADKNVLREPEFVGEFEHGLQGVNWGALPPDYFYLGQYKGAQKGCLRFALFSHEEWQKVKKHYHLVSTRPKPKYTKEQIDAVRDAVMYYQKHIAYKVRLNFDELQAVDAEQWLKEQGYE